MVAKLSAIFLGIAILVSAQDQTGDATFYTPGTGACGITNSESDFIVAVSSTFFDTFPGATPNPNTNPICGKTLTANYNGAQVTVTVTDKCPGCAFTDLDLSPAAFQVLADPSVGRLHGVTWHIN